VTFKGCQETELGGLDGVIHFATNHPAIKGQVCRSLTVYQSGRSERPEMIQFSHDIALDRRLRGRQLLEQLGSPTRPLAKEDGDHVLAMCNELPLWTKDASGMHDVTSVAPEELGYDGTLRDQVRAGRFLSLLPLVHYLREIEGNTAWSPPPLRATFLFDDPNLHFMSYGHVNYRTLSAHARQFGYHVAFATIPIDLAFAHPKAVQIFQAHSDRLSLTIHGNNHTQGELLRAETDSSVIPLVAQALRRTAAFEARYGLPVNKVMVPPHAVCSERTRCVLFQADFEAITMLAPVRPLDLRHSSEMVLAGWEPAQILPGEIPVLVRHLYPFANNGVSFDEVVLCAFLNLPLILFGHHWDLSNGLDALDALATEINSLGQVEWMSLGDICRTNFAQRLEGSTKQLELYSRRVSFCGKETDQVIVKCPALADPRVLFRSNVPIAQTCQSTADATSVSLSGPFPTEVTVELVSPNPIILDKVQLPRLQVWPVLRRVITESRDQAALLRRRSAKQ
jgi:hypothetical protein